MRYPCGSCGRAVRKNQDAIFCDLCNMWFHKSCTSLLESSFKRLGKSSEPYYCEKCFSNLFPFSSVGDDDFLELCDFYHSVNSNGDMVDHGDNQDVDKFCGLPSFSSLFDFGDCFDLEFIGRCSYYASDQFSDFIRDKVDANYFSLIHINARSLMANFENITDFLKVLDFEFSIIAISESWLKDGLPSILDIPSYNFVQKNRISKIGGGVGLYINKYLMYKVRLDLVIEDNLADVLFLELFGDTDSVLVGVFYRPPSSDLPKFNIALSAILDIISREQVNRPIYFVGDFNINLLSYNICKDTRDFIDLMFSSSLFPLIDKPTRISDHSATLIDNIFSNRPELNSFSGILVADISDHFPIFHVSNNSSFDVPVSSSPRRLINDRSSSVFSQALLGCNFGVVNEINDVNLAYDRFVGIYSDVYDSAFPLKQVKDGTKRLNKPWITAGLLKSLKRKNKLYIKFLRLRDCESRDRFVFYRNKLNHLIRASKRKYYLDRFINCKNNLRAMWGVVNDILGKGGGSFFKKLPNSFIVNGVEIFDPMLIANGFNSYFVNVGANLAAKINNDGLDFRNYLKSGNLKSLFLVPTSVTEITEILYSLDVNKSSGDMFSPALVRLVFPAIAEPLCHIMNLSLASGIVPSAFKIARVTPIFKSGDVNRFDCYRPISVLPFLSKILERLVYFRLMGFLEDGNILSSFQYGFRKNHSTFMALAELTTRIIDAFNSNQYTIGVFLDLSKAFDSIDHGILLSKLYYYGIRGVPLKWFESYLLDRQQFICYNGVNSRPENILFGVPQGSILGPLLFLLYINDVHFASHLFHYILFADDTSVFMSHCDLHELIDSFNSELYNLSVWFKSNKLSLNISKTSFMVFCRKNSLIHSLPDLIIDDMCVSRVSSVKFLGVFIQENLSWDIHIHRLAGIVARNVGIINRIKFVLPFHVRKLLYSSFVASHFHYCNIIWGNSTLANINRLFLLQKRAIRVITLSDRLAHTEPLFFELGILKIMDIYKLQLALFVYKQINGLLPCSFSNFYRLNSDVHHYSTRGADNIFLCRGDSTLAKRGLLNSGAVLWNSIDVKVRDCGNLSQFKRWYRLILLDSYVHYDL